MGEAMLAETQVVKEVYAALNRNDITATVEALDPDIEWIEPSDYPLGGIYHGRAALHAHMTEARATWAEGACEPQRFIVAGDKVVVLLHVHVRLNGSTAWLDGDLADVFTFRDGQVIQFRSFPEAAEALAWAGVVDPAAD